MLGVCTLAYWSTSVMHPCATGETLQGIKSAQSSLTQTKPTT